ncbi:MAG: hypothetical protein K2N65_03240 [Anaeroplasmataceae bacterium]|nr:hypothetical protein [Anaeroplasmataceae bacterium]
MKKCFKYLYGVSLLFLAALLIFLVCTPKGLLKESPEDFLRVQEVDKKTSLDAILKNYETYFDSYQLNYDSDSFGVNCSKKGKLERYEFLSTVTEEITYITNYNIEKNLFSLTIFDEEASQLLEGHLIYNEIEDDYFLVNIYDSDDFISLKELVLNIDFEEECAYEKDLKYRGMNDIGSGGAAIAVTATFVLLSPKIVESVDTTLSMIGRTLSSFWNWFCGLFAPKTQTKVYAFEFNGVTYQTQAMSKADVESLEDNTYYLCVADKALGCFFFTTISVDYETAVLALESARYVTCLSGSGNSYILSTWTRKSSDAERLARDASAAWGYYQSAHWHDFELQTPVYMEHWHPGPDYDRASKPHSFFGAPAC